MKDSRVPYILKDKSTLLLIISNIITIIIAVIENWDFVIILFVYWCQSVIIGFFAILKILNLKEFSTENFYVGYEQPKPTEETKKFVAGYFATGYVFMHLLYIWMIIAISSDNGYVFTRFVDSSIFIISSIVFFLIAHFYSYIYNKEEDSKKKQNIGSMFLRPFARIIPIHFAPVIFGFIYGLLTISNKISLVAFLLLKTLIDVIMHISEHKKHG